MHHQYVLGHVQQHEPAPYPRGGGRQKNQRQAAKTCLNDYEHGPIAPDCPHPRRRGGEMYTILHPRQPNQEAKGRTTEVQREVEPARHELDRRPAKMSNITLIGEYF